MDKPHRIVAGSIVIDYLVQNGARGLKEWFASAGRGGLWSKKRIVHEATFNVRAGECFGIVGANGSGKSTLLRALAGIAAITSGRLEVRGRVAPLLALGSGLEPELTGLENVALLAAMTGHDGKGSHRIAEQVRQFSGLSEEDLHVQVKRYSSGMCARLAFSIATAEDPDILLIDEALAVGDAGFQRKCHERIQRLKEGGSSIVLVSHSLGEVQAMCDRAACMEHGRMVMVGHPHEVGLHYHRSLGINDPA